VWPVEKEIFEKAWRMSRRRPAPHAMRGGCRFADKDMRQRLENRTGVPSILVCNLESDPQPRKSAGPAEQQRRVGERAFTPKLGNEPPERRANQDSHPNRCM
jgi:hypothetical protein